MSASSSDNDVCADAADVRINVCNSACLIILSRRIFSRSIVPLFAKEQRILLKIHDNSERSLAVNLPFVAVW